MRVSVLTPTYNRSESILRLYQSLENSTYKDFKWIVMDDGSTDNTQSVMEDIQRKASFQIIYLKQENKGKYIALNELYAFTDTEYCFQIDDDDELLPDAMEKGLAIWDSMDKNLKDKTWCVCGRCIDANTGNMVGNSFPDDINFSSEREKISVLKSCQGEKCGFQKVDVVKQYKFPVIEGCNFIFESFLWDQINAEWNQYYTNSVFRIYHIPKRGEANLSNRKFDKSVTRATSDFKLHKYILKECPNKYKFLSKKYLRSVVYTITNAKQAGIDFKAVLSDLKIRERIILLLGKIPVSLLMGR